MSLAVFPTTLQQSSNSAHYLTPSMSFPSHPTHYCNMTLVVNVSPRCVHFNAPLATCSPPTTLLVLRAFANAVVACFCLRGRLDGAFPDI